MDKKMFDEICLWWKSFVANFASSMVVPDLPIWFLSGMDKKMFV